MSNEAAAVGGKFEETVDEVRENAKAYFGAQNRSVTREDYVVRTYFTTTIWFGSKSICRS